MAISHRDLKPENILLDRNCVLKISDFGLASFMTEDGLVVTSCGSPCYASPECISGEPYDGRTTDVWSVGVITYAMVTGALPWTEASQTGMFNQIRAGQYHIPRILSSDCRHFLRCLLTVDAAKRSTIPEALLHRWLANVAVEWEPCPIALVSLKRVDRFFSAYDFDGEDSVVDGRKLELVPTQGALGFERADRWLAKKSGPQRPLIEAGGDNGGALIQMPARNAKFGARAAKIAKPVLRKIGQ
jgi:serine/threonine protein kinase